MECECEPILEFLALSTAGREISSLPGILPYLLPHRRPCPIQRNPVDLGLGPESCLSFRFICSTSRIRLYSM